MPGNCAPTNSFNLLIWKLEILFFINDYSLFFISYPFYPFYLASLFCGCLYLCPSHHGISFLFSPCFSKLTLSFSPLWPIASSAGFIIAFLLTLWLSEGHQDLHRIFSASISAAFVLNQIM